MSMIRPLAAAAVSVAALAFAAPALAAPASAFECPPTEAAAEQLLSQLKPMGPETTDEYNVRTRLYDPAGRTVNGVPVYKLETIIDADDKFDYVAFQAKTNETFETTRAAMFAAAGRSDCQNSRETTSKVCKIILSDADGVLVMRYVERSITDGINFGCQYARDKG